MADSVDSIPNPLLTENVFVDMISSHPHTRWRVSLVTTAAWEYCESQLLL